MSDRLIISLATVPDIAALRTIHKLEGLSDDGVLSASLHLHRQQFGAKELPLYQQQIISIAVVKCSDANKVTLHCPTELKSESELLHWFNALMDKETSLVAWDMNANDKPLINYRLLKHEIVSESFSKLESISLKDKLSAGNSDAVADFEGLSSSLGLPELVALTQLERIEYFLKSQLDPVHESNQSMSLNMCAIFHKYQLINGTISRSDFEIVSDEISDAINQAQI
jgi:predicted PolB exonuclease-like 3'-5' exonuclease